MSQMPDIHTESAWARTKRDFQGFVTDTIRFVVWFTFCNVVVVGATTYFSWGHQRGAQLDIGVGAFIVGAAVAFALPLGAIWVIAPVRQRNEARELIVRLQDKPGFPDVVIKTGRP